MKTLIKLVNTPLELDKRTEIKIKVIGLTVIVGFIILLCAFGNVNGLSNTYLG